MSSQASPEAGRTPAIGDILRQAGAPQSVAELRRSSGLAGKLTLELQHGVEAGDIYEWPGKRYWDRDPAVHVEAVLQEALASGPQLLRAVLRTHRLSLHKLPAARIAMIVNDLHARGRLHLVVQGKDQLLSLSALPDPNTVICAIAGERPFAKPALVAEAARRLPFLARPAVAKSVDMLAKTGALRQKGKGKTAVLFARPSNVQQFLHYILAEAVERVTGEWQGLLEPMGVNIQPVQPLAPAETGPPADLLMAALREMEPQRGLPVAIQKLRRHRNLAQIDKKRFDQAAAELVAKGRAFPFHHTAAFSLTPDERDQLADDGQGTYYVGLAWRD